LTIGEKLQDARKRVRFSQQEIAQKLGLSSASAVCDWEADVRVPTVSQLQKLSTIFKRSVSYFLEQSVDPAAAVLWRKTNQKDPLRTEFEAKFIQLARQYRTLEVWTNAKPTGSIAELMAKEFPRDSDEAEELAETIWRVIGLGDRPGESLLRIFEEMYGLKVFHLDLTSECSSASYYDDEIGPAVLLSRKNIRWRRNYDLAHELFHLLTWKAAQSAGITGDRAEQYADKFAEALLMPAPALKQSALKERNDKGSITIQGIEYIARQFDVSYEALGWRLKTVFHIEPEVAKALIKQLKEMSSILPKRDRGDPPRVYPTRYIALAKDALRSGEIATHRFTEYLELMEDPPSPKEVEESASVYASDPTKIAALS